METIDSDDYDFGLLFDLGEAYLRSKGFFIRKSIANKATCFLEIRHEEEIQSVKGMTVPENATPILKILSPSGYKKFKTAFKRLSVNSLIEMSDTVDLIASDYEVAISEDMMGNLVESIREFWTPLFKPKTGSGNTLEAHVMQCLQLESDRLKAEGIKEIHQEICHDLTSDSLETSPRAAIPPLAWFDDKLDVIEIKDILTLWPEAEQEIFSLSIGRALAGANKSLTMGGHKLEHGWRIFPILYGKEPGQGKSTICNAIIDAMQSCGYKVANFKSLHRTFNMGRVAQADLAYRDDFTSDALKSSLGTDDAKPAISGAILEVQDKGTNAIEVPCTALFLANVNKFDPRIRFQLDGGMTDRVKFLTTYSNIELSELSRLAVGASKGTPSLRTHIHLPFLAKKLDVDKTAIILYFLRLCLDKFMDYLNKPVVENPQGSITYMEDQIKYYSARLRTTLDCDHGTNFAMAMLTSIAILHCKGTKEGLSKIKEVEVTPVSLRLGFSEFCKLAYGENTGFCRDILRKQWEREGCPSVHPWKAFENLKFTGVIRGYINLHELNLGSGTSRDQDSCIGRTMDLPHSIQASYSHVITNEGHAIGAGVPYVLEDWEQANTNIKWIKDIVSEMIDIMDEDGVSQEFRDRLAVGGEGFSQYKGLVEVKG